MKAFEKKSQISLKKLMKVSEKDSAFTTSPLELRIVFLTLQESDQLAQQRRHLVVSSAQWEQHKRNSLYETLKINKYVQSHSQFNILTFEEESRGDNKNKENL